MRVNSALNGLFIHRGVGHAVILLMVWGFSMLRASAMDGGFTYGSPEKPKTTPGLKAEDPGHDRDLKSKQVNLLIRLIGHQLLLQSGDSISRVLPVTEVREGTFLLQLEKQLFFSHDSLIALSQRFLPKSRFPSGYTVTVHDCFTASIIYGFQINHTTPDLLACQGRHEPAGCYSIEFAFADFYKPVEPEQPRIKKSNAAKIEIADTDATNVKSIQDTDTKPLLADESESNLSDTQSNAGGVKASTNGYPLVNLVYTSMLISLGVTLVLARFRLFAKKESDDRIQRIEEESPPPFSSLGKFQFDVKGQRLLLGSEVIAVTEKECRILELLNSTFGELVTRETLMQKIWINEGVITGRSLDMFVSKLRKKLAGDPDLRITNVHGKGYMLEIDTGAM
ncbi:MAG TPA: winged helix-turn-helix domain-containing protein [Chryseosolibacter sp.]